jgi:hypothetical protein
MPRRSFAVWTFAESLDLGGVAYLAQRGQGSFLTLRATGTTLKTWQTKLSWSCRGGYKLSEMSKLQSPDGASLLGD